MENKFAILEGLLFAWGDPLSISEISKVLEVSESQSKNLLNELEEKLKKEDRGLRLIQVEDMFQLSTKPEIFYKISDYARNKQKRSLSNAAMETLSIIAYRQPVIKSDIEEVRGVRCDQVLRNLQEVGLIEIKGRLECPGRPNVYGTTEFFLKKFGLSSIDKLPDTEEKVEALNFLEE